MRRGFDASAVQGRIPFWLLSDDIDFVVLKGQQGNDGFDPTFASNVALANDEGVIAFAYAFAYPLPHLDPREQARLFVDRTVEAAPAMAPRPLFLDFEWPVPEQWRRWGCTAAQISAWCAACAEEVESYAGVTPVIYTYPDWWAHVSKADVSWAALYPLWLASYWNHGWPKGGDAPKLPAPWAEWLFWQFDGNGGLRLPNGVDADFCVFNGDEEALRRLAGLARPVGDGVLGPAAVSTTLRPPP